MTTEQRAPGRTTGVFVYGVVPGDVEPMPDARGVGDPPGRIKVLTHGDVAALVSEVPVDRPLGRPADLEAFEGLLNGTAEVAPVIPVRFGAVLTDPDAITELLARYEEQFATALGELEGQAEYIVRGRYVEDAVLGEVLAENEEVRRLRDAIAGKPEEAARVDRIRLGEIVNKAVEAKRAEDTQRAVDRLSPYATQAVVREPTHEQDAVTAALLVAADRADDLEDAVRELGEEWSGRVTLRLLGPLAAYDFVAPLEPRA
jgi:hypothetical protein